MIEPDERLLYRRDGGNLWQRRARQHDHRKLERPRRGDLAVGRAPAAVLRHHHINAVALEQRAVLGLAKQSARGDIDCVRHGERRVDRIDAADEIDVLRRCRERLKLLAAKREEHAARRLPERAHRLIHGRNLDPAIAIDLGPRLTSKRNEWHAGCAHSLGRVGRDGRGVRVCRVDQRVYPLIAKISGQTVSAAETADAHRDRLRQGVRGAACERQCHGHAWALGERVGKQSRLDRAAKDEGAARAR